VNRMGNQLTIFFSTVGLQEPCGMPSSSGLVSARLCLVRLRSFWPAGGLVVVPRVLSFGKWSPSVLCGVFGVSEIFDVSRIPRGLLRIFFFDKLSIEDLLHVFLFTLFSWIAGWLALFLIFFLSSPSPPRPFVYPQCTKGCAPFALFNKLYCMTSLCPDSFTLLTNTLCSLSSVFQIFSKISLDPAVSSDDVGKLELLVREIQGGCVMERQFSVEAKAFCFTAKEGSIELRLEERRKGFVGVIRVGLQGAFWLVAKVEEVVQAQAKDGSAKGFREDENCLLVREGCNKDGRFLEVAVEVDGGRKGTIRLPKGRKG
jgi:hypothetical protein